MIALAFHEPDKLKEKYEQQMRNFAIQGADTHPLGFDTEPWYDPNSGE